MQFMQLNKLFYPQVHDFNSKVECIIFSLKLLQQNNDLFFRIFNVCFCSHAFQQRSFKGRNKKALWFLVQLVVSIIKETSIAINDIFDI